jgi:ABC-type nitrate/sulfonate/bicarbonate transport system substrate-binding protein
MDAIFKTGRDKSRMNIPLKSRFLKFVVLALALAACTSTPFGQAPTNEPMTLRVNVFRGASNLPIYMAIENGYYTRLGITPVLEFTPNSIAQRTGLAEGKFEIAHAAVDNAVAMIETAKADVVIVAGGDGGLNEFLVRKEINQIGDLKGRTFAVDAPNTAYALLGRKILKNAGLIDGKDFKVDPVGGAESRAYALDTPAGAVALLSSPWNMIAKDRGAKSLGTTAELYGPYQAGGIFLMRSWAKQNAGALERYITAYIEGCRAALDPAKKELALKVLARELKLTPRMAEQAYLDLNAPGIGLSKDCAFNLPGFRNVLALRAEIEGQWGGKAPEPDRYLDLSFYERALQRVTY